MMLQIRYTKHKSDLGWEESVVLCFVVVDSKTLYHTGFLFPDNQRRFLPGYTSQAALPISHQTSHSGGDTQYRCTNLQDQGEEQVMSQEQSQPLDLSVEPLSDTTALTQTSG